MQKGTKSQTTSRGVGRRILKRKGVLRDDVRTKCVGDITNQGVGGRTRVGSLRLRKKFAKLGE